MKSISWVIVGLLVGLSQQALAQRYTPLPEAFYVVPVQGPTVERAAANRCALSFGSVLTQTGMYLERNTPVVADLLSGCIQDGASPSFTRECDLVSVQLEVDLVFTFTSQQTRRGWLFDAIALSPEQEAIVWRNHMLWEGESDTVLAALDACAELGLAFLASQAPDSLYSAMRWVSGSSSIGVPAASEQAGALQIVDVTPSPVAIWIDGALAGTVPGIIDIQPGTHLITLRTPGCEDWTARVRIRPGEVKVVDDIILDQENAILEVVTNVDGAEISVDGEVLARAQANQPAVLEVSPASWDLRIHHPGYGLFETSLLLSPGGRQRIVAELVPAPPGAPTHERIAPNIPILGEEPSEEEDWITILPRRNQRRSPAMTVPDEESPPVEVEEVPFEVVPF